MTNIEKLAQTINQRCQGINKANNSVVAEIGTIRKNGSLKVTGIKNAIPKGQYMKTKGCDAGAGSTVLVIWVGAEPIVIDKLIDS